MRQGEVGSQGSWIGDPQGGVTAPDALILPNPATRFSRTADRLQTLSAGHPLEEWLRFMAQLAKAQHLAATTLGRAEGPPLAAVEQAVEAGMPPLAADGHRRDPIWRKGLTVLMDELEKSRVPQEALAEIAKMRAREPAAIEVLADTFLHGSVDPSDVGATLYVAAALQVYFTNLASALPAQTLNLLPQRGLCPCCGSTPVSGLVTASGKTPGTRYLYCSLCSTAWNYVRAICITCGEARSLMLEGIEGDSGAVKAETCNECHSYAKMLYQSKDTNIDPFADDLATLGLDILVGEAGWSRHAPNPLLIAG